MRCFFVTSNIVEHRNLLQSDRSASLFIETMYSYRAKKEFEIHEFTVMPNHFHLEVSPRETVERAAQLIKGGFSHAARTAFGWNGSLWLRSFRDRRIRSAMEYEKFRDYIYLNPVKAGLCHSAEEWPYGSASGRFELDPPPREFD
jgi:putative transposase